MGGVSPVWAEEVPSGLGNPAGSAGIDRVTVAMGGRVALTSLSFRKTTTRESADETFAEWLWPSSLGAAIPLRLVGQHMAVSATYDGPAAMEWDGTHAPTKTEVARKGSAFSISLGAAWLLSRRAAFGIGLTRWVGETRWELSAPSSEQTGQVRQHYRGTGVHFGAQTRGAGLAAGIVLHLPHRLMSGEARAMPPWGPKVEYLHRQEFPGAVDFGIGYAKGDRFAVATSAVLQRASTFQTRSSSWRANRGASGAGKVSAGVQYQFALDKLTILAYISYGIVRMPKAQGMDPPEFLQMTRTDDDLVVYELTLGASAKMKRWALHLMAQWLRSSFAVGEHLLAPPWS
jgi:hypothetical protein